jgi:6-methylsalicylate decarboxylase
MIEFPFDTTRAVTNLIFSGTLERCPDIRIIVPLSLRPDYRLQKA